MDDRERSSDKPENGEESPGKQTQGNVEDYDDQAAEKLIKEQVLNFHSAVRSFS
jgi:hypothetical protein